MTIQSSLSKALYYGDGNSVNFAFNFKVFNTGQITVTVADSEGNYDVVEADSISLNSDGTGTVVYTLDGSPLPEGYAIAITRDMDFLQEKSFSNAAKFDAAVVEACLDQACAERQQILEKIDRAVILPATSAETPEEVVANTLAARDEAVSSANASATSASASANSATAAAQTAESMASSLASAVTTAVSDATASATASASAAATSATSAAASENAAAGSAITAQSWAESETPPDPNDAESKSAKTWALSAAANVPFASTTYAGKVMASDSLQVNTETGEATVPNIVPTGGIIMWSGSTSTIPIGWGLCDGTNGTPDLRDRFIIGAGGTYDIGDTGGSTEVSGTVGSTTLTTAQMPSHKHSYNFRGNTVLCQGDGTRSVWYSSTATDSGATGSSSAHSHTFTGAADSNLPPYYALAYIMKL